jgi:hypothetical protein
MDERERETAMKKLLAIALAACLPTGLAAEDPEQATELALGSTSVLVIEDSSPITRDVVCAHNRAEGAADCMAVHRAVLTARLQKVSARERSRWM